MCQAMLQQLSGRHHSLLLCQPAAAPTLHSDTTAHSTLLLTHCHASPIVQALELQVSSLQEKVSALQAAADERSRNRRWLPELPETVSTRQALLGAALLASASAAAALLYGRQQALAAR